jgi:hypothetical protein
LWRAVLVSRSPTSPDVGKRFSISTSKDVGLHI